MPRVTDLKLLPAATATLAPVRAATAQAAKDAVDQALIAAAGVDGDRVVDAFEADAIRAAYDEVRPGGGPLAAADASAFQDAVASRLAALKAARAPATRVLFTSEGDAVARFRGAILGAVDDALAKANGKPVDMNVMIFAFTDAALADGLLQRARDHANLNLRILTDWGQLPEAGGRQGARMQRTALDEGLANVFVKFKKDAPYLWDPARGPAYNHGATLGLNHHKGFVVLVDGRPQKAALGSFNWSIGAMEDNFENLMILDRRGPQNRAAMFAYEAEFEAFWNDDAAALTMAEAQRERERLYADLHRENGAPYTPRAIRTPDQVDPQLALVDASGAFDVNSFEDEDRAILASLVGATRAGRIDAERAKYGRFDSVDELFARVPALADLTDVEKQALRERAELGDGGVSLQTSSAGALDRAGFTARQAAAIVGRRATHGFYANVQELVGLGGITANKLAKLADVLSLKTVDGAYSARVPGQAATTGYAASNRGTWRVPDAAHPAARVDVERTLAAPVMEMLRGARPGEVVRLCMYGISATAPEFAELKAAVERGVVLRGVFYDEYNAAAFDALDALQGDVDYRVIKSRVMHEKFGVKGDDVFNGSANFSTSSTTKHSEDRFLFRADPDLAAQFVAEFDRLWARGSAR